jgi:hypothetical protein
MAKVTLTHRMKDIARKVKLKRTSPRRRKRRVAGILKKTPKSGVSSTTGPWHNTYECRSKQSLVVELKEKESELELDSDSKHNKGKQIIDAEPTTTIAATTNN